MTGIPLKLAAQELGIDASTLQRDVQNGCPVIRKGRRGPGDPTLVDLEQVRAWRGQGQAVAAAPDPDVILQQIATALLACLKEDHCDIRAGCFPDDAKAVLLAVWKRMCRTFGKTYPFDQQPAPISALAHKLYDASDVSKPMVNGGRQ